MHPTREVAIVAYARSGTVPTDVSEVEMLMPVLHDALAQVDLRTHGIGFTCSGSCDYLAGRPFSFTLTLDGVGAWPPISESHVETDGAWALYEAWVKLLTGDADTALVYSYGKPSGGDPRRVLTRQLDPYYLAPLWPGPGALAGLQRQALADAGLLPDGGPADEDEPLAEDGAAAVVLAAGDTARRLCERPAWIRGLDHRTEAHSLGVRDLTDSPSTRTAGGNAGAFDAPADTADLHAPYPSQTTVLRRALNLTGETAVSHRAGPLMAAGLISLGEAAARVHRGESRRALAHATSGPCLQQNLVAVLESDVPDSDVPDSGAPEAEGESR